MTYRELLQVVIELPFDIKYSIYRSDEYDIYILRPSKPSSRFKFYDPKKNFQIWLQNDQRDFKPNHLRVMIDLYLRKRSRPDLCRQLALAFDSIFYGQDPLEAVAELRKEEYAHFLNSLEITALLAQLFLVEQAHGYHKPSNYDPSTLFFQGWVRQIFATQNEIDDVIMSIASRRPPALKYTRQDDRKHKIYNTESKPLWWLE